LTKTSASSATGMLCRRTIGVLPTRSRTLLTGEGGAGIVKAPGF